MSLKNSLDFLLNFSELPIFFASAYLARYFKKNRSNFFRSSELQIQPCSRQSETVSNAFMRYSERTI